MTAPSEFDLRVQHGIAGGFIAPEPTAIYELSLAQSSTSLKIASLPTAQNPSTITEKSLDLAHSDTKDLVDELYSVLKELPSGEDIYGLDVGIAWQSPSDNFYWTNMTPGGSGIGNDFRATEVQREKYKRAIEISDELVKRGK